MNRDIITRRNLPHWYVPNAMHFITFRLAGTYLHDGNISGWLCLDAVEQASALAQALDSRRSQK